MADSPRPAPSASLSWRQLVAFGAVSMPISLLALGMFMFVPRVYAASTSISMQEVGLVIFATRLWDFVSDPLVGWLSDRTRSRFGRRVPWIMLAWLPLSLAAYKLFTPPADAGAAYLGLWSFLLFASGTALFMPYTAMAAELSTSYHERSRIFAYRHVFAIFGTLTASFLYLVANNYSMSDSEAVALHSIAVVGIVLLPATIAWALLAVREPRLSYTRGDDSIGWRRGIRSMLDNRVYRRVLLAYFCNGIANALPVTLIFFFVRSVLNAPEWTPVFLIVYFLAAIAGTPLWLRAARRSGKHVSWCQALMLAAVTFAFVPLLGPGDAVWFLPVALVAGLTLGADLAMPAAMLADVVDQDVLETGRQRTGIYFAAWGMAAKLAAAAAVGFSFPVLDLAGFVPDTGNSDMALLTLALLFGLAPALFKLLALLVIWRYPLTAARQAGTRRAIVEKYGG